MRIRLPLAIALAAIAATPGTAAASGVAYPDADWTEASIVNPTDGTVLHADVLRPKGATDAVKTPVILSIGPYFNHSGQTGPAGPVEDAPYDPVGPSAGPSERFQDYVEGTGLLKKGYTFVMVDLRGFGGSTGCLDWGGPGEQSDIKAAVEWAAARPWSTGSVGMYGKSYDAATGLLGANLKPTGLKAVVAQEPVYDLYRYLYGDGIRRENSLATPALYDAIALTPGPLTEPAYDVTGATDPACAASNFADQALDDDHDSPYWKDQGRNAITGASSTDVPLILTQGLTENNTVADGTAQYLQAHKGYERAWLGPWEHVRGNEVDEDGVLKMGRQGWFDETMRFYDRFLKGIAPTVADPPVAVQDNTGTWRSEARWPPADASGFTTWLRAGTYTDQGTSWKTGMTASDDASAMSGVWSISQPLPHAVHLAGSGQAFVKVRTALPNANLAVDVYDLDGNGEGPLITRQGHLIRSAGESRLTLDLWSADWKLPAGHRIGVRVTDTNQDWWLFTVPTLQTVTVDGASVTLPFLRYDRTETIQGDPGVQLESYLADRISVTDAIRQSSARTFTLPAALEPPPAGSEFTGGYLEPLPAAGGSGGDSAPAPAASSGGDSSPAPAPAAAGNAPAAAAVAATAVKGSSAAKAKAKAKAPKLVARVTRGKGKLVVQGTGPKAATLTIALVRNGKVVATKRVKTTYLGTYRATFAAEKAGSYAFRITGRAGTTALKTTTRATRLR